MKVNQYNLGFLQTNCFVIYNSSGQVALIDPGDNGKMLLDEINKQGKTITKIILTHGHFDHIGGAAVIQDATGCDVYIHELDNELLEDVFKVLSPDSRDIISPDFTAPKATVLLKDGDTIEFGDITFTCMHTPGHTKGSCMFFTEDFIFSGDTLFRMEIGRNDLYGGSPAEQRESLKKIAAIKGDYTVCPGHGENSTLAYEQRHNPYLREFR